MAESIAAELSAKMDAGLAVVLIMLTGLIMFYIGLITPFLVVRLAKLFKLEFGEFFADGE